MFCKMRKSKRLNEFISQNSVEYIKISESLDIEGRYFCGRISLPYSWEISITIIHKIMVSDPNDISHILKDTFYFDKRTNNDLKIGTAIGVAGITSLYTNISHDLKPKALEYWIEKLHQNIKHLEKFTLKRMSITLSYIITFIFMIVLSFR